MKTITLTSHEEFLLDLLKVSIDTKDPKLAKQSQIVLGIATRNQECDRGAIWQQLTPSEKAKFKELIK